MGQSLYNRLRKLEARLERQAHLMAEPRVVLYLPDNRRDPTARHQPRHRANLP
jgi:hypothetical protein